METLVIKNTYQKYYDLREIMINVIRNVLSNDTKLEIIESLIGMEIADYTRLPSLKPWIEAIAIQGKNWGFVGMANKLNEVHRLKQSKSQISQLDQRDMLHVGFQRSHQRHQLCKQRSRLIAYWVII
ncbi:hypothetical protein L1887_23108 [Cichorium endivia]|nr:hypothetical protein L1887_23108 [Cichorium endivia]